MKAATCVILAVCACLSASGCSRPAASSSNEPEPAAAPPALDLSRQHLSDIAAEQSDELAEPEALLPDMFDTGPEPGVKLDGRLITDKAAQDLHDKVDGAEVTIEIPTS